MGQCESTVLSDKRLGETELEILKFSGLQLNDLEISSIYINDDNSEFVRTIRCGNKDGQTLVLVHGYGGSGLIFYKILNQLAAHFNIYLIDIIGMGASSRPKFEIKTAEEADQYFVDFIEKWRQKVDITNFYLAGHSFGGYICGHYAYRYPQHLKKLLMLSPAGVVWVPEDFDLTQMKFKNGKKPGKLLKAVANKVWEKKWSPFGLMRGSGSYFGKKIIKSYLNKRMASLPKDEFDAMLNYMHQILLREGSTEYAIFICFKLGMFAHHPLETVDRLGNPDLPIPVTFYYGDQDWMDPKGGQRTVENNKFYEQGISRVFMVTNSDHHMYLDNPDEFASLIIHDILTTEEKLFNGTLLAEDVELTKRLTTLIGQQQPKPSDLDGNIAVDSDEDDHYGQEEEAKLQEILSQ